MTSPPASSQPLDPTAQRARQIVAKAMASGLLKKPGIESAPRPGMIPQAARELQLLRAARKAVAVDKESPQATAEGGVVSQWVDITPELAQYWLSNNYNNRALREDTVVSYARDMASGSWVSTHQGIAFNDLDLLIDGQHRLHAIVRAGVTVRMMVTFGLPAVIEGKEMTVMDAVDRGATRSVADQLRIQHGFKRDSSTTAAVCASIAAICCQERTRRLTVGQTLEIYRAFEVPISWVIANRVKRVGVKTAGFLAAFAFALTEGDHDEILKMWDAVVHGDDLTEGSPVFLLRQFLQSDQAALLTRRSDRGLSELVMQALYLQLIGRHITTLEPGTEGLHYFRARQPERVEKIAQLFRLPNHER